MPGDSMVHCISSARHLKFPETLLISSTLSLLLDSGIISKHIYRYNYIGLIINWSHLSKV